MHRRRTGLKKVLAHLGKLGGQLLFVVIHVLYDQFVIAAAARYLHP